MTLAFKVLKWVNLSSCMTYLEAMSISNVDEEAGQSALSSEHDKACHGSMLKKTRSNKFTIVVVATVIILSCNTH